MRVWTSKSIAPVGLLLLAVTATAVQAGPGTSLTTPALLSIQAMAPGATPELRVVADNLSGLRMGSEPRPLAIGLRSLRDDAARPLTRGMQAIARYSFFRADESPTPWEEGTPLRENEVRLRAQRVVAGHVGSRLVRGDDSEMLALADGPGSSIAWSATSHSESKALALAGEASNSSILRKVARLATPVLEVADALRALRLNQIRVSDGMTLKFDGRTGRHARCFAILTQRF